MSNIPAALPDQLDPELDPSAQAQLAQRSVSVLPTNPASTATTISGADLPIRRFRWQKIQGRGIEILAVFVGIPIVLWWLISLSWSQFVGTWLFTSAVLWQIVIAILLLSITLLQVGENIPYFGRSWFEISPNGIRMRLFYGRKPRVIGNRFNISGFLWRCRARLNWNEVARVALYKAYYISSYRERPSRTMYWVKLWSHNLTGYTLLITENQQEAEEAMRLLAQGAKLRRWAQLGHTEDVLEPNFGPLDADTLALWHRDRRRISAWGQSANTIAALWRTTNPVYTPFSIRPKMILTAALWLVLLTTLITAILNYDWLLSYALVPNSHPSHSETMWLGSHHDAGNTSTTSQTIIPPLHEVWHTQLLRGDSHPHLSLAAGKLLVISTRGADVYDAQSGKLLSTHNLYDQTDTDSATYRAFGGTINAAGDTAYVILIKPNGEDRTWWVIAINLTTDHIIWWQNVAIPVFLYDATRTQIITIVPKGSAGAPPSEYILTALDARSGEVNWQISKTGILFEYSTELALASDNLYLTDPKDTINLLETQQLVALDPSNGQLRWEVALPYSEHPRFYYANETGVYAVNQATTYAYTPDGKPRWTTKNNIDPSQSALFANTLIAIRFASIDIISQYGDNQLNDITTHFPADATTTNNLVVADGLLYVLSYTLDGYQCIAVYDLSSRKQVWHSSPLGRSGGNIIAGNGLIYTTIEDQIRAFAGARLGGIFVLLHHLQLRII